MVNYIFRMVSVATIILATIISGCYVGVGSGYYGSGVVGVVDIEPPAPQVEVIGVPPYPGYFWVDGYWYWEAGAYRWYAGHWEAPRAGYRWVPRAWHRDGARWRLHGGYWGH